MNEAISRMVSSRGRPTFAKSEGLVVTPSTQPISCAARISFMSALSIKNFMRLLSGRKRSFNRPFFASNRGPDRRQDGSSHRGGVKAKRGTFERRVVAQGGAPSSDGGPAQAASRRRQVEGPAAQRQRGRQAA